MTTTTTPETTTPTTTTSSTTSRLPLGTAARFVTAGSVVVAVAAFLPWMHDSGPVDMQVSTGLNSGGIAIVIALAGAAVWTVWNARGRSLSKKEQVGLGVILAVLALLALTGFGHIAHENQAAQSLNADTQNFLGDNTNLGDHFVAGLGLYLFCAGVAAMALGTVRMWFARRNPQQA